MISPMPCFKKKKSLTKKIKEGGGCECTKRKIDKVIEADIALCCCHDETKSRCSFDIVDCYTHLSEEIAAKEHIETHSFCFEKFFQFRA